jgi:hypothetical protein
MRMNRTGIGMSPADAKEMIADAERFTALRGTATEADELRRQSLEDAKEARETPGIGTVPPPASLKGLIKIFVTTVQGERPTVFLDKLGERLAFERTGTRLYEGLLLKHETYGTFAGGPSRDELLRHRDEEAAHMTMLEDTIVELGADPTAMTPSADLAAVESMGVLQAVRDPRTNLAQSLHAMLAAELVDGCAWEMLGQLATELGYTDLVTRFAAAEHVEQRHLTHVRGWVAAAAAAEAKLGAGGTRPSA